MKLKLTLLTILVALLTGLSIYGVYGGRERRSLDFALISAASDQDFDSQTAYVLPVAEPNYFPIRRPEVADPPLLARAFLLYDVSNDKIVLAKNSRQPLPVASLTKLLTAIIVMETLSPEMAVTITTDAYNVDAEGADFYLGEKVLVRDLLAVMLVKSSNDAAAALAQAVEQKTGGRFSEIMNRKGYEIGMVNSFFFDPAGLNDDGYSTAEDLLKLARYSKKYPSLWQFLGLPSWEVRSADARLAHSFSSTNKLFETFPDILGGKTGYTDGALGCMILEVKGRGGPGSFLAIVLGSPSRFDDTRKLIQWGREAFRWE